MEQSARLNYIDQIKGIAIYFVIVGHIIIFCLPNFPFSRLLLDSISTFNMPLFAFISGLLFKHNTPPSLKIILRHIQRLIFPFISVSILFTIYKGHTLERLIWDNFKHGYWFLLSLFCVYLLAYLILFINKKINTNNIFISEIMPICGLYIIFWIGTKTIPSTYLNLFSISLTMSLIPGFFCGYIINKHKLFEKIFTKPLIFNISSIIFPTFILTNYCYHYSNLPLDIIISFIAIYCFVYIIYMQRNIHNNVKNLLEKFGRNSLGIYVCHYFFINFSNLRDIYIPKEYIITSNPQLSSSASFLRLNVLSSLN